MVSTRKAANWRVLVIDDDEDVRLSLKKILTGDMGAADASAQRVVERLEGEPPESPAVTFELDLVPQGEEGLDRVLRACAEGRPYAMVIVDAGTPPAWDGATTVSRIMAKDPRLQFAICTHHTDHSWDDIIGKLGLGGQLLVLRKPFDRFEVCHAALALCRKWELQCEKREWMADSVRLVEEPAAELKTINERLRLEVEEHARSEVRLQSAQARLQQLLTSMSSVLIGITPDGNVSEWNQFAESTLGVSADRVLGQPFAASGVKWDGDRLEKQFSECETSGRPVRLHEFPFTAGDGRVGYLEVVLTPLRGPGQVPAGVLLWATDVTGRKSQEEQSLQAQKLESIGHLAAGIAHEINTPIQFIGDNVAFLKDAFGDMTNLVKQYGEYIDAVKNGTVSEASTTKLEEQVEQADVDYLAEEVPAALEQSQEGVARVADIVRAMKEFSHPGSRQKEAADINRAIENTVTVARNEWKYVANLSMELDPKLPEIPCLLGEFGQVILNLLINAAHAIGEKGGGDQEISGTITIRSGRKGDWAEVTVADTGKGVPKENQRRIFDPFFTTKAPGKGSGQGLAIARSVVVDKHGGTIHVESEPGQGATFVIRLPICSAPGAPSR